MSDPDSPPPVAWSPETRTWISLVLFAHLFALLVAVTSYTRPSDLQRRLHAVFEPYLRNLHLTALPNSYPFARFHLGHGGATDVDFQVEVTPRGSTEPAAAFLMPEAPLQPLIRLRRYQALANATGTLASGEFGDAAAAVLPKTISAYALKHQGVTGGTIVVRALGLPEFDEAANLITIARASHEKTNTVYEAQAIVGPSGVELLRKATTLEIAPVEGVRQNAVPSAEGAGRP